MFNINVSLLQYQYCNYPCQNRKFRPPKFWGRVKQFLQNFPRRYLSSWRLKANIWIFQIAFSQWIAPLTKNSFLVIIRGGLHLQVRKISLCQSIYSCFLQYPLFWTTNWQILFLWLNICIFTPLQTKKIVYSREMGKIQPFTFTMFSLSIDTIAA